MQDLGDGRTLVLLHGCGYRRNVSARRFADHEIVARRFARMARRRPRPDLILCSFPTVELGRECVRYGERNGVPVVLDVRDLWPDIFLDAVPAAARPLGRLALRKPFADTRRQFERCTAVIGVSDAYVAWGLKRAGRAARRVARTVPLAYRRWAVEPDPQADDALMAELGVPADATVCTFVGTFGRTYDLNTPIAAARALQGQPVHFVICGDGERGDEWRGKAEGLSNITFAGWLNRERMSRVLTRSHLGLAAYEQSAPQGIPNKPIEYLSFGLPMLSSLEGETAALIEAEGLGVHYRADDVAGFLAGLDRLRDPEHHAAASQRAARWFDQHYDSDAVYGAFADYLEEVAAAAGSTT